MKEKFILNIERFILEFNSSDDENLVNLCHSIYDIFFPPEKFTGIKWEEGKVYMTKEQVPEPFKVRFLRTDHKYEVVYLYGEYKNRPNLGICILTPQQLTE